MFFPRFLSLARIELQISPPELINQYLSYYDVTESICRLIGPILLGKMDTMLGYRHCEECIMFGFVMVVDTNET